jgi:hypothetical protein
VVALEEDVEKGGSPRLVVDAVLRIVLPRTLPGSGSVGSLALVE